MRIQAAVISILLSMFSALGFAADVLTAADVEKATGLTGIKVVAKNPMKGAGGELNFATADDKMVVTIFVQPESMYAFWKKQYSGTAVAGLGDEAFSMGAKGSPPSVIFRKGKTGVWVQSLMHKSDNGWFMLKPDQAMALAKIAVSRM